MKQDPTILPLIAITATIDTIDRGIYMGQDRFLLNCRYPAAVSQSGGVPIILPYLLDHAAIEQQLRHMHGVILSGGHDLHPSFYQEDPHPDLEDFRLERDRYELAVFLKAMELEIPVLGICRGMQLMNAALGGTLYQDLGHIKEAKPMQHRQSGPIQSGAHRVTIAPDTLLSELFNSNEIWVNSFHHQGVKKLAPKCRAAAYSADGLIEALEHEEHPFCVGVQWHPEQLSAKDPLMLILFKALIDHAIKRAGRVLNDYS